MFAAHWQQYVSIARIKIDCTTHLLQNNRWEIYFSSRDVNPTWLQKGQKYFWPNPLNPLLLESS